MDSIKDILNDYIQEYKQTGKWKKSICDLAAAIGDLDIIKYAHQNNAKLTSWAAEEAVLNGQLECLEYISKHVTLTNDIYLQAIEGNNDKCIQFLNNNYPLLKMQYESNIKN